MWESMWMRAKNDEEIPIKKKTKEGKDLSCDRRRKKNFVLVITHKKRLWRQQFKANSRVDIFVVVETSGKFKIFFSIIVISILKLGQSFFYASNPLLSARKRDKKGKKFIAKGSETEKLIKKFHRTVEKWIANRWITIVGVSQFLPFSWVFFSLHFAVVEGEF